MFHQVVFHDAVPPPSTVEPAEPPPETRSPHKSFFLMLLSPGFVMRWKGKKNEMKEWRDCWGKGKMAFRKKVPF